MLLSQRFRLSLEVILEGLGKYFPAEFGLRGVPLLLRPQSGKHLGLAMPRALLDVHERLQAPLFL